MLNNRTLWHKLCKLTGLVDDLKSQERTVYRVAKGPEGVNVRRWLEPPASVPHDNVDTIWTGPADSVTGFPTHPNAPTAEAVENDFTFAGPDDQVEAWAWVTFPEDVFIRDNNQNTGERGEVWLGRCGGNLNLIALKADSDTLLPRGIMESTFVSAGTYLKYVRLSDFSANQGYTLQTSPDGENDWANFSGEVYAEAPRVECLTIGLCDEIPEGYTLCKPEPCVVSGVPTTATVFPTQEICEGPFVDVTGRTGWVFPWTAVNTANTGTITGDWVQISSAETAPTTCATDITVVVDGGEIYHQIVNARAYHWIDFRLLIDGNPVVTNTSDNYLYLDERTSAATVDGQPIRLLIENSKQWVASRNNVPAGSIVTVEMRRRYNHSGFQTGGSVRTIGGLRSKATINYFPRNIVTGRV